MPVGVEGDKVAIAYVDRQRTQGMDGEDALHRLRDLFDEALLPRELKALHSFVFKLSEALQHMPNLMGWRVRAT